MGAPDDFDAAALVQKLQDAVWREDKTMDLPDGVVAEQCGGSVRFTLPGRREAVYGFGPNAVRKVVATIVRKWASGKAAGDSGGSGSRGRGAPRAAAAAESPGCDGASPPSPPAPPPPPDPAAVWFYEGNADNPALGPFSLAKLRAFEPGFRKAKRWPLRVWRAGQAPGDVVPLAEASL